MNPIAMQMLAKQLGITPENLTNMQPDGIAAALANQTNDPLMAALITQMASQQSSTSATETPAEEDGRDYDRELNALQKIITRLKQQLASAEIMARYIADVFGACPVCWGLNRLCQQCGGKGKPGYAQPDVEELRAWVEPALRKGGLHIATTPQT